MAAAPRRTHRISRIRTAAGLASVALLTAGLATIAAPTAATADQSVRPGQTTLQRHASGGDLTVSAVPTPTPAPGAKPAVDPPPNCRANVGGDVKGNYDGKTLANVVVTVATDVTCEPKDDKQTMARLSDIGHATLNNKDVFTAETGSCTAQPGKPCVAVKSTGTYTCAEGVKCAGDYRIAHDVEMELPAGWTWNTPPTQCTAVTPATLKCRWTSNPVPVAGTLP